MLIFDVETNGLLVGCTLLHCICIKDTKNGLMHRFDPMNAEKGVRMLQQAIDNKEPICGHNVINFDIPALEKLYRFFKVDYAHRPYVIDTLVLSRLVYSNLDTIDLGFMKSGRLPKQLYKSHSLKAWGYRLGVLKGNYGEQEEAWAIYTPEMLDYNEQDVLVTEVLLNKLLSNDYAQKAIDLEHQVAWLMAQQERNGFKFDIQKAKELEATLRARQADVEATLINKIPMLPDKIFIPKRDNKRLGYKAGVPIQKYKTFNPNSRQQIEYVVRTLYAYSPDNDDLYDIPDNAESPDLSKYRLKIDEETFKYIKHDEKTPDELRELAALIEESLLLKKRLGQLADGKNAWLTSYNAKTGCIHGRVIPNGAVSGRATHSSPNVAQVPSVNSLYGKECRELFNSGEWFQAGIDASGLELRCLAHFMFPFDNGEYAHEILNGDIHTKNQIAAGLPTRANAKVFVYAFLYGAGDGKIGKIINATPSEGKKIKRKFLKATPAIADLKNAVAESLADMERGQVKHWKRKYLKGLDGRLLHVRSLHSALNLLLQSAGALVCKKWIVVLEERLLRRGLKHGWDGDFVFMAWVHDEAQIACRTREIAEITVKEAQAAMRDTQDYFKFRVQLDTEGKIGRNWSDCH